jgi:hypothetical protein
MRGSGVIWEPRVRPIVNSGFCRLYRIVTNICIYYIHMACIFGIMCTFVSCKLLLFIFFFRVSKLLLLYWAITTTPCYGIITANEAITSYIIMDSFQNQRTYYQVCIEIDDDDVDPSPKPPSHAEAVGICLSKVSDWHTPILPVFKCHSQLSKSTTV